MAAAEWIDRMVEVIVDRFQPLRVIIFGSHARGTAATDSDIDFLVVLPSLEGGKRRTAIEIRRCLDRFPVSKDVIVTTPEEIDRRGHIVGTLLRPALREGKTVYERPADGR